MAVRRPGKDDGADNRADEGAGDQKSVPKRAIGKHSAAKSAGHGFVVRSKEALKHPLCTGNDGSIKSKEKASQRSNEGGGKQRASHVDVSRVWSSNCRRVIHEIAPVRLRTVW